MLKSVSVADAAYESQWYNDEYPEVRRALQMIIQRAGQREQKLTALGIANLDFVNFINVSFINNPSQPITQTKLI